MTWVIIGAIALTGLVIYDIHQNSGSLHFAYLTAPVIGSVKPPPLEQIGPTTNTPGSVWLGGQSAEAWSYAFS